MFLRTYVGRKYNKKNYNIDIIVWIKERKDFIRMLCITNDFSSGNYLYENGVSKKEKKNRNPKNAQKNRNYNS